MPGIIEGAKDGKGRGKQVIYKGKKGVLTFYIRLLLSQEHVMSLLLYWML